VLIFGLKVSLIGMGIVFFALILLVFIIKGISLATAMLDRRTSPLAVGPPEESAAVPVVMVRQAEQADEGELAAVIIAAVAAYRGDRG
jgi:sodium pump decarboxylase gamma subunit